MSNDTGTAIALVTSGLALLISVVHGIYNIRAYLAVKGLVDRLPPFGRPPGREGDP